ncbi:ATP-binding cassette domain-containing protein, partial [Spirillospora sp. NPDC049652]
MPETVKPEPATSENPMPGTVEALLEIEGLSVRLAPGSAARPVLDAVSLRVAEGETVGLVGESGSGKSVTGRAVLGLLPAGAEVTGSVRVAGWDVLTLPPARLRELRRREVAMVFQDPRASINAVRRIGDFVTEGLRAGGTPRRAALKAAEELLEAVGIDQPRRALRRFPHEFSGGMLQRVMIAGALAGGPRLLLADEPT